MSEPCKHCGHCPHCGQPYPPYAGPYVQPYNPWQPVPQIWPQVQPYTPPIYIGDPPPGQAPISICDTTTSYMMN